MPDGRSSGVVLVTGGAGGIGAAVTVNALCPGFVDTPMVAPFREPVVAAGARIADPDHVAAAFDHVLGGGGTGQAWIVTAGEEPFPATFPHFLP